MRKIKNHTSIAIIWWSFAGLSALLILRKRLWKDISIKLFDKRENFCYIPALHECILANDKKLDSIQFSLWKYYPDEFIHEWVSNINNTSLTTDSWENRTFDYAIVATWSATNFYWNKSWKENAKTVRFAEDISWINKHLHDLKTKNITIVWWGFTWVEVAAIIAQKSRKDQSVRIIHSWPRLFHTLSNYISETTQKRLERHNVEIILWKKVDQIESDKITTTSWTIYSSDLTIVSTWIKLNDHVFEKPILFHENYYSQEYTNVFACWDVAFHWLYTTAHNAMIEWRRVWDLIANIMQWESVEYHSLLNRDKLAIALWSRDGILTNWKKGFYFPWFTGLAKWFIEKRVLIEFKYKILLWI